MRICSSTATLNVQIPPKIQYTLSIASAPWCPHIANKKPGLQREDSSSGRLVWIKFVLRNACNAKRLTREAKSLA